jgi:hypothetical protein
MLAVAVFCGAACAYLLAVPGTGPTDAAPKLFLAVTSAIAAWVAALFGTVCGVAAAGRSGGRSRTSRAALVLNALLAILPAIWLALLWSGSYLKSF